MKDNLLQKSAKVIYDWLRRSPLAGICFPIEVQRDIRGLGKEEEAYYIQKLVYGIWIMLAVAGLLLCYAIKVWLGDKAGVDSIERPAVYEEAQKVSLQVGSSKKQYEIEVAPRAWTREEAEQQLLELTERLETYILGQNPSLDQVCSHLLLPEYIEGYPFDIYWESDKEQYIDSLGTVYREGLQESQIVVLTANITYGEWSWEYQFGVCLQKEELTQEEQYTRELKQYLLEDELSQRNSDVWQLPKVFQGEALQYGETTKEHTVLILAAILAATGIALWIGQDNDLRAGRRKIQEFWEEEYVGFVSSLSLYISAGLNLQTAMSYCARDYECRKPASHLLREALLEFQKDVVNGYGFVAAIERFAGRADQLHYRRLAGILNQGFLNGAKGLPQLLQQEVDKIREEKRRQSKVTGEKISTALIAPMMLQLGIVIALIMIPAFTNMQF